MKTPESAAAGEAVTDLIYEIFMAIDGTDYEVNKPRLEKAIQAALEPLLASGRAVIKASTCGGMCPKGTCEMSDFAAQLARFERRAGEESK